MAREAVHEAKHMPAKSSGGRRPAPVKHFRSKPLGTPSGPPIVISGFNPDPWFIGYEGNRVGAFTCIEVTFALFPEPTGNEITTCEFGAVQIGFNYQTLDALLELTLYTADGPYGPPFTIPFNSASEGLLDGGGPADQTGYVVPQLTNFPPLCK